MQSAVRPKLGNPKLIFSEENTTPSYSFADFLRTPRGMCVAAATSLSVLTFMGMLLIPMLFTADIDSDVTTSNSSPAHHIETVSSKTKNGQLVGTLIRDQRDSSVPYTVASSDKTNELSSSERERLLAIISN